MENATNTQTIAAALYLIVEPHEHKKIFADNPELHFKDKDDAQRHIKSSALTENQRVALFAYLYLYSRLQKLGSDALAHAQKALSVPKGAFVNLEAVITQPRIDYIHKLFKDKHRDHSEIFTEPDGFILKMIDDVASTEIPEEKRKLKGLKSEEYEHEEDKSGLEAMKSMQGFATIVKNYNEFAVEKTRTVELTGSNYLVTESNLPHVFNAVKEACKTLDIHKQPPLYIAQGDINAFTVGTRTPILCLMSGCLSLLSHDELLFVIGHELGHIKSGHFQYHSMAGFLAMGGELLGHFTLGLGNLAAKAIEGPLMAWFRKSELTADRAGLLSCQNPEAAFTCLTKMAGYPLRYYSSINPKDILAQARAFEDLDGDTFNQFVKFFKIFDSSHPWTIMRAKELDRWIESGKYRAILNNKAVAQTSYADSGGGNSDVVVNFKTDSSTAAHSSAHKPPHSGGITINFKK